MDMFKVTWHDDASKLHENYFVSLEEAEAFIENVKPHSWWPEMIEIEEVTITYSNESTTDYAELSDRPWDWDWGRFKWWDGVDNPDHLRKQRTND